MNYKIVKEYKEAIATELPDIGYTFKPKKTCKYSGIKINKITISDNDLIRKVLKRKIKYHLDKYLQIILDNFDSDSDDDSEKTLIDLKRYNRFIKKRYSIYLDKKYMELLNKRIGVIQRELENSISYEQEEYRRTR